MANGPSLLDAIDELRHKQRVVVVKQGKLLSVGISQNKSSTPHNHGRSIVRGFTPASRLRLLKFVATVNWSAITAGVFVTLTYPDCVSERKSDQRNRDRYLFHRYVEKKEKKQVAGVWRVEFMPRKSGQRKGEVAPHLHLLLFGVRFIAKEQVRAWWRKILGVQGPLATHIDAMNEGSKASLYIAKYMGKQQDINALDNLAYLNIRGRHYGFIRKGLIPMMPKETLINLTDEQIERLWAEGRGRLFSLHHEIKESFALLGDAADVVYERIIGIGLTEVRTDSSVMESRGGVGEKVMQGSALKPEVANPLFSQQDLFINREG